MAKENIEKGLPELVFGEKEKNAILDFNRTLAKRFCPVSDGKLRKSIKGKVVGNKIIVGTDVDYAMWVERGTGIMVRAHGEHNPKYPVKDWEAKRKRGDRTSLQQMPYLASAAYHTMKSLKQFVPSKITLNVKLVMR